MWNLQSSPSPRITAFHLQHFEPNEVEDTRRGFGFKTSPVEEHIETIPEESPVFDKFGRKVNLSIARNPLYLTINSLHL